MNPTKHALAVDATAGTRSLLRPRNLALLTLAAFLCGVVWLSLTAVSMTRAKPGTSVNYTQKVIDLRDQYSTAGGVDGFPLLSALTAERRLLEGQPTTGPWIAVYYDAIQPGFALQDLSPDDERRKALAILAKIPSSRMPGLWNQLAASTRYDRPLSGGPLVLELLPELGEARQLARMNVARMYDAADRSDYAELVRAYEHTLALARVLSYEPFTISRLVSLACRAIADAELRRLLIERRFPQETLDALIAAADRQPVTSPRSLGIQAEKLSFADFVQRTHSDTGNGNGRLLMGPFNALLGQTGTSTLPLPSSDAFNVVGLALPSKRETLRRANAYYDLVIEQIDLPRIERDSAKLSQIDSQINKTSERNVVIKTLLPAFGKLIQSHDVDDLDSAGTRLMLAIERHRTAHGQLPQSLSVLTQNLTSAAAKELTTDPFTGKPFGYIVLASPEAPRASGLHGRDYLLYSFGLDAVDNSGRDFDPDQPLAALNSTNAAGTDYILNRTRKADAD